VRVRLLLVWVLAAAVLGGCVNVDLELWVEPDGSGRSVTRLAPAASASPLFKQFAGQELARQMRESASRTEALLKADPNVTRFAYREEADGGTPTAYVYEVEVKDITQLDETMARVQRELAPEAGSDSAARQVLEGTRAPEVVKLDNGNYRFSASLGGAGEAAAGSAGSREESDNPFAQLGQAFGRALAQQVFQDAALTVRVHGSEVLSGNGQLEADKRAMVWRVPLGELVGPGSTPRVLEAEVRGTSPLLVWAVLLGFPLAVVGLALLAARRRRRS
jgi:hypothetical protein